MKLHVVSDLHLDVCSMWPAQLAGDVLVVAGDAANGSLDALIRWCDPYLRKGRPVLFVPGNHEYYGRRHAAHLRSMHRRARAAGIRLLHNAKVRLDGVEFFGATLWTDFALEGAARVPLAQATARQHVADFTCIFEEPGRPLRPETTVRWHRKTVRLLERFLRSDTVHKKVVVTHHAPAPGSIHERFAGSSLNPAFVNDLEPLIRTCGPALWVHGHTHRSVDYRIGATRVLANPRGYGRRVVMPGLDRPIAITINENPEFNETQVTDI